MPDSRFGPTGLVYGDAVVLVPTTTATGAGSGPTFETRSVHTLRLALAVSAVAGTTPTLTVSLEHSPDGAAWTTHSAFPAISAAGSARRVFTGLDRYVRCTWAVTGTTPSFTFVVAGESISG